MSFTRKQEQQFGQTNHVLLTNSAKINKNTFDRLW